jgi:predicted cation transporter
MIGLSHIFVVDLVGPLLDKKLDANLEVSLFPMGIVSSSLSTAWNSEVIHQGSLSRRSASRSPCSAPASRR